MILYTVCLESEDGRVHDFVGYAKHDLAMMEYALSKGEQLGNFMVKSCERLPSDASWSSYQKDVLKPIEDSQEFPQYPKETP